MEDFEFDSDPNRKIQVISVPKLRDTKYLAGGGRRGCANPVPQPEQFSHFHAVFGKKNGQMICNVHSDLYRRRYIERSLEVGLVLVWEILDPQLLTSGKTCVIVCCLIFFIPWEICKMIFTSNDYDPVFLLSIDWTITGMVEFCSSVHVPT